MKYVLYINVQDECNKQMKLSNNTPHAKSSKQKSYPNVKSYLHSPPPRKSGFQDLLSMDDISHSTHKKDKSSEKRENRPRNTDSILQDLVRIKNSIILEEDNNRKEAGSSSNIHKNIHDIINDYTLYTEVTVLSNIPFKWINKSLNLLYKHTSEDHTPHSIKEIVTHSNINDSLIMLGQKLMELMRYYRYSISKQDSNKSSILYTLYNVWNVFLKDKNNYFYMRNVSYHILFSHKIDHLLHVLSSNAQHSQIHNIISSYREQHNETDATNTHMHYCIISVLKANVNFIKRLKTYGTPHFTE